MLLFFMKERATVAYQVLTILVNFLLWVLQALRFEGSSVSMGTAMGELFMYETGTFSDGYDTKLVFHMVHLILEFQFQYPI